MKVGKPHVGMTKKRACSISASLAPAPRALAMWVAIARWCRLAAEMPSLMSQRVFSSKGPPCR